MVSADHGLGLAGAGPVAEASLLLSAGHARLSLPSVRPIYALLLNVLSPRGSADAGALDTCASLACGGIRSQWPDAEFTTDPGPQYLNSGRSPIRRRLRQGIGGCTGGCIS